MNYPKVSIIILNWNGLDDTIECLESLKKITYPNYQVVVVDNGSVGDDAKVLIEIFGKFAQVIRNDKNSGYTGGNNIGIRYCLKYHQSDYFLVLNNDTIVAPDFLDCLIHIARMDDLYGILGAKVYYYQWLNDQFRNQIQSAGGRINLWTGQPHIIGAKQTDKGQYDSIESVDYVSGCCMLIKREVIDKVGLFDENYFCYWDEADYCFRARKAEYKVIYVSEAKIWHKSGIKNKAWEKNPVSRNPSEMVYYYLTRNSFKFMRKHASRVQFVSFIFCFFLWYLWSTTATYLLYHRDIGRLRGFYKGIRDGLQLRR